LDRGGHVGQLGRRRGVGGCLGARDIATAGIDAGLEGGGVGGRVRLHLLRVATSGEPTQYSRDRYDIG
jgi:hypothetical protein